MWARLQASPVTMETSLGPWRRRGDRVLATGGGVGEWGGGGEVGGGGVLL